MAEQTSRLAIIIDSTGAERSADSLASALGKMTQAGEQASNSANKVKKATKEEADALSDLLDRIDPVNAALNKLDKQQRELSKFKAKNMIDDETFDAYSKQIEVTRNRLTGFSDQLNKTGMSAKQTAAAMRMVPAQMTDIVVSLASGQAPLTVLLQQGGQLKDMFGGVVPAAKALGGYVAGLINPFTLAAAAVGVLGLAYYKGSQEQDEFYKSLTLTGNLIDKTSSQLADIAARVSVATNSTTAAAASTLNQLVSSGKVAGDSLERVTTAIVKTSDATGIATDKLVVDFNDIAADPVAAITKLNEQYHFLTLATYNQIKALQDEGNTQEAARVATDAYANTMQQRSADIQENLGLLEKSWKSLSGAAKDAWDTMLNIGREQTVVDKLATLNENIADAQKRQAEGGVWNRFVANSNAYNLEDMIKKRDALQAQITTEDVLSDAITKHNQAEQKRIKIQQDADRSGQQYLTNSDRRAKAIQQETKFLEAGAITAEEYAKRLSRINEMYKDPEPPKARKGKAYTEDAGTRMLDQLRQQQQVLMSQADTGEKIGTQQQALIKWEQQLSDLESRAPSQLTNDQKSLLLHKEEITSLMERNVQQEKNNRLMKDATEIALYQGTLQEALNNRKKGYSIQTAGYGLGTQQQQRLQESLRLEEEYNQKRQQLDRDYADKSKGMSDEVYQAKSEALASSLAQDKANLQQHYAELDAMNSDWAAGVNQGFQNWLDSASNYSTQMSGFVQGSMDSLIDTMADGLSGSKVDWEDWSLSVLKSLQKVLLNAMIVNSIKSIQGSGMFGSLFSSPSSGSTPSSLYDSSASSIKFNALGGIYDSPSLSSFSNGVYDSPKLFAFAKGAGVFGEAGPEAIMPLTRTADGSLGVRMTGANGASGFTGDIIIQQTIHVNGNGDAALNQAMQQAARKGAQDGAKQARQEMLRDFQTRGQARRLLGV